MAAQAAIEHPRQKRLKTVNDAVEIDPDVPVPKLIGQSPQSGTTSDAGIVEQERNWSQCTFHRLCSGGVGCAITHIEYIGLDRSNTLQFCLCSIEGSGVQICQGQFGASACKAAGYA